MKKNRIITFLLTLIILFNILPFSVYAAEGTLTAPQYFSELYPNVGAKTPIRPVHQYLYRQNPPSFLWPAIDGAPNYELVIYSDEALTKVYRRVDNIRNNYYLFTEPFETGKYYWWTYRYKKNGNTSTWSVARRFKVATDAKTIIMPTAQEIISKTNGTHPRLYITQQGIPSLIEKVSTDEYVKKYFEDKLIPSVRRQMSWGIPKDPTILDTSGLTSAEIINLIESARSDYQNTCISAAQAALVYYVTGDTEFADYAASCVLEMATWNWQDEASQLSFKTHDVYFMRGLGLSAIAYDWIADYLSPEDRKTVAEDLFAKAASQYRYVSSIIKESPYSSHDWSCFQSFGAAFAVTLGDIYDADIYFDDFCQILFSNYIPYSIEDGGFSKGMNYWLDSFYADNMMIEALSLSGVYDFYDIPFNDNHYLWGIYMFPTPGANLGSWGDSGEFTINTNWLVNGAARFGKLSDHPELLWWKNKFGTVYDYGTYDGLLFVDTDNEGRAPIELPKDWHFKDQGMTAMHSDLINEPRISATFRSGMYGSYNHSHADINSFMIESNGKPLAWRSGYYGYYFSDHHRYFSRASYAHNTITYDNGKGQDNVYSNFDADGVTTMYLSNSDMSAAVGDGKEAYIGGLSKFDRTFIYLRPDSYIVVDNLKASEENIKENGGSTFEWWLNSIGTIDLHSDNLGAKITYDDETLDARIHYPKEISAYYSNLFAGPDGKEYLPHPNVTSWTRHERVWFKTEKLPETKMIATMSVGKSGTNAENVKTTEYTNYMKLEFESGETAYVSKLTDETQLITADNFRFNGTALVINHDHIMFIGGTKLYIDSNLAVDADRPVAVTMGEDELGISSADDYNITLYYNSYMPNVDSVRFRNDDNPVEMGMGVEAIVNSKSKLVNIHADKGHYSLLLNDKPLPGDRVDGEWNYTLTVNGNAENRTTDYLYYSDSDYNIAGADLFDGTSLKENVEYHISDVTGDITYGGKPLKAGDIIFYSPGHELAISRDDCSLSLDSYENTAVAFEDIATSYVEFTKDDADGTVSARVRVTNGGEEPISARLILAAFDSEDKFLTMTESTSLIVDSKGETHYEVNLTNPPQNAENYKAFLWRPGSVIPFAQLADSSAVAELKGIEIDGVAIEGFDKEVTAYSYEIPTNDNVLPVVKGIPWDNAIYTTTAYKIAKDSKSAVATITLQNLFTNDEAKTYTVNITLSSDNTGKICDHISDFTTYFNGITADTYGGKVYLNYGTEDEEDVTENYPTTLTSDFKWAMDSNYRISPFDGVRDQFEWQGSAGYMRYYSNLDRITGIENSLYMRQSCLINVGTANNAGVTATEIQKRAFSESAFFGSKIYNYSTYSPKNASTQLEMYDCTDLGDKLWASFKVTRDCDVIIVSRSSVPASFLENPQYGWKKVSNAQKPAIEMIRMQSNGQQAIPMISVQSTYYIQSFEAGDTVELYNANNGLSDKSTDESTPSYHVFVRVK